MFSDFAIGFLAAVGLGGWLYAKLQRSSGGNTVNSLIAAVISGIVAWVAVGTILGIIFNN